MIVGAPLIVHFNFGIPDTYTFDFLLLVKIVLLIDNFQNIIMLIR